MAKLRYPFDPALPNAGDDPWTKLDTIVEHLQDGEAIPHDLASWLAEAIRLSGRDPDELSRRLGLKRRGKPAADPNAWLNVGKRICDLEDFGLNPEEIRAAHPVMSNPEALRPYRVNPDEVTPSAIGIIAYERMTPEEAIATVAAEFDEGGRGDERISRSQLQKFRDAYRAAWHVAHNPD